MPSIFHVMSNLFSSLQLSCGFAIVLRVAFSRFLKHSHCHTVVVLVLSGNMRAKAISLVDSVSSHFRWWASIDGTAGCCHRSPSFGSADKIFASIQRIVCILVFRSFSLSVAVWCDRWAVMADIMAHDAGARCTPIYTHIAHSVNFGVLHFRSRFRIHFEFACRSPCARVCVCSLFSNSFRLRARHHRIHLWIFDEVHGTLLLLNAANGDACWHKMRFVWVSWASERASLCVCECVHIGKTVVGFWGHRTNSSKHPTLDIICRRSLHRQREKAFIGTLSRHIYVNLSVAKTTEKLKVEKWSCTMARCTAPDLHPPLSA